MTMPDEDRERLRRTFNEAAGSYQRARPDYPAGLFDDLIAIAGLAPGDHLLEVGCGPGKATLPPPRMSGPRPPGVIRQNRSLGSAAQELGPCPPARPGRRLKT